MSITDTRTVGSIVGGDDRSEGQRIESRNPANLEDVICEAVLGDADTFVDACRAARAAQRDWAAVPAPVRGNVVKQIGRLVEDNKEALSRLVTREIGKPYPEALGEVQEIIDTCDFFLSRGPAPVRADGPERDARQAALHLPQSGRRGRDHHGRQLPRGGAVLVSRAGDAVRQRRGLEARRVRAGARRRAGAGCSSPAACRTASSTWSRATARRPSRASSARSTRGSSTRSASPARRAVGSKIGELTGRHRPGGLPRAGRQEPARGDARRRPRPRGRGCALQRLRHGRPALHLARHGDRPRVDPRRVREPPRRARSRRRRSATRPQDVLYGPMIHERFAERFEDWLGLIRDHHRVSGSTGTGRITSDNPRPGFVGDPDAGIYCHPTIVDGVTADDDDLPDRDLRPDHRRGHVLRLRRGDAARQRPRLRALVGDLHERPEVGLPLPRARERRAWSP